MKLLNKAKNILLILLIAFVTISLVFTQPILAIKADDDGEALFMAHCSGCHINGGNIVRRRKTLKLESLKKNGINDPEAIAKIAREGIASMSGYKEVLGPNGDDIVANWIWMQAQNAWTHG